MRGGDVSCSHTLCGFIFFLSFLSFRFLTIDVNVI